MQGNRLPQELRPYWGLFLSLFKPRGWSPEGLFGQSFSIGPPVQALRGCPCLGVLLCCSACQAHRRGPLAVVLLCRSARQSLKGAPWVKSCSVVQCVRCLMGQPLYCSAANASMLGGEMAPPPMGDSEVSPCFHGCLAFLHRHFLPQSPPSHPLNPSLHNQQQPFSWDCSTIPKLQLPAAVPSRGPASLSRVCMAATRTV